MRKVYEVGGKGQEKVKNESVKCSKETGEVG